MMQNWFVGKDSAMYHSIIFLCFVFNSFNFIYFLFFFIFFILQLSKTIPFVCFDWVLLTRLTIRMIWKTDSCALCWRVRISTFSTSPKAVSMWDPLLSSNSWVDQLNGFIEFFGRCWSLEGWKEYSLPWWYEYCLVWNKWERKKGVLLT